MATNDGGTAPNDGGMATNDGALTMTLTSRLVQLVRAKPVDDADRRRAALLVLDAVANAIAGRRTDAGERLWRWGKDQGQDAGRRALVAGGLTHILEIDDLHRASVTHPGCVVVPAALSVGLPQGQFGSRAVGQRAARLRGLLPCRDGGRPVALSLLAQHGYLRSVRFRSGGGRVARAERCSGRTCAGQCRDPSGRSVGVPANGCDEQAPARRSSRRGRRGCCGARGGRLHRGAGDPGGCPGFVCGRVSGWRAGGRDPFAHGAMAVARDLDQALALLSPYPPRHRRGLAGAPPVVRRRDYERHGPRRTVPRSISAIVRNPPANTKPNSRYSIVSLWR